MEKQDPVENLDPMVYLVQEARRETVEKLDPLVYLVQKARRENMV